MPGRPMSQMITSGATVRARAIVGAEEGHLDGVAAELEQVLEPPREVGGLPIDDQRERSSMPAHLATRRARGGAQRRSATWFGDPRGASTIEQRSAS